MSGIFWEQYQNRRIADAEISASRAATDAANLAERLHSLEKRIDGLLLLNRAMWAVLEEKTGLTEADLQDHIEVQMEIMLSTQQAVVRSCPQCGRTMKLKQERCLYCGAQRTYDSLFDRF